MISYFDTSALVKLLVAEPGSDAAARAWRAADAVAASLLVYPEARAALAQAVRTGRMSDGDELVAVATLESLLDVLAVVRLSRAVAWTAGDLARRHALRGYDAVHLASAVELRRRTRFVTADLRLARAADEEGLPVRVPS